jgi:DNA-binding LacI/PurR family transcriptional regulator
LSQGSFMVQKITIRDVAARAGVSYQTVSRVLNDRPDVSEETRQLVKNIIGELGYRPNRAAKSLAGRQSSVLGAIVRGFSYFGPAQLVAEAEYFASQEGYDLLVDSVSDSSEEEIGAAIDRMDGWSVDGILININVPVTLVHRLVHIPIVQTEVRNSPLPAVYVDQEHGVRQAVRHLLDLGHTSFGEVTGPFSWNAAITRHLAKEDMLAKRGIPPGPFIESDWTVEGGYHTTARLLAMGQRFTALIVGNDEMAIGAIHALRDHGLEVPTDVSVIGMDDIPIAAHIRPPLTTIRQDFKGFSSTAIQYLLELIKNPDSEPEQRAIFPELMVRDSTAPPP